MRIAILIALLAQLIPPAPKPGHAAILSSPAEVNGAAGAKLALFVDVTPKPGIHVYAPGSKDYIPITVKLNAQPEIKAGKVAYPKSEMMTLRGREGAGVSEAVPADAGRDARQIGEGRVRP